MKTPHVRIPRQFFPGQAPDHAPAHIVGVIRGVEQIAAINGYRGASLLGGGPETIIFPAAHRFESMSLPPFAAVA
jgi:hypothetical protein